MVALWYLSVFLIKSVHQFLIQSGRLWLRLFFMVICSCRYCEERPLLLSNAGMGANLCAYHQKSSPGDQGSSMVPNGNDSLGNLLSLDPGDKSPFLGEIKPSCSQSSLETNMYRAPVFSHKVPSTDFLLVRSAKGKISIRRIDKVAVVGQQVSEASAVWMHL